MTNRVFDILLVEDNPGDARLIEEYLAEAGGANFRCRNAPRLAQAFDELKQHKFDIVLLDLSLPDSSGYDTFRRLQDKARRLPVIVLTGLDDEELGVRTVNEGAQDYLLKGQVDPPLLVRAIRYAIERKKAGEKLARYTEQLRAKNEQIESELQMAREIQSALLPHTYPTFPPDRDPERSALLFCHRYQPTATLAGDYFEILPLSENEAGLFICDVMGHGVRAALVTAYLRGLIEELTPFASEPGTFLTEINRGLVNILKRTDTAMFASACYLVVDIARGRVEIANAGHPTPLLGHRSSGRVEPVRDESRDQAIVLGLVEDSQYPSFKQSFRPGDILLLYTDGVYEAESPDGEQFGEERLEEVLRESLPLSVDRLCDRVMKSITDFAETEDFGDDICIVTMEFAHAMADARTSRDA
jgi:serine phosphatase RsbU (regulator of sigma subunit)